MSNARFFGSSAFVKRYFNESGTGKVLEWCDKATEIGLAGILPPEIISAFCRLHREARITDTQYRQLKASLMSDIEDAALCDLAPAVLALAINWHKRGLEFADAFYLANSQQSTVFFTFDKKMINTTKSIDGYNTPVLD